MENSWAQTIHAYDQSRRALPWKTEEFIPAHNLTLREVSKSRSTIYI